MVIVSFSKRCFFDPPPGPRTGRWTNGPGAPDPRAWNLIFYGPPLIPVPFQNSRAVIHSYPVVPPIQWTVAQSPRSRISIWNYFDSEHAVVKTSPGHRRQFLFPSLATGAIFPLLCCCEDWSLNDFIHCTGHTYSTTCCFQINGCCVFFRDTLLRS